MCPKSNYCLPFCGHKWQEMCFWTDSDILSYCWPRWLTQSQEGKVQIKFHRLHPEDSYLPRWAEWGHRKPQNDLTTAHISAFAIKISWEMFMYIKHRSDGSVLWFSQLGFTSSRSFTFSFFSLYVVMKTVIFSLGGVLHYYRRYQEIQQLIAAVILTCCLMNVSLTAAN